MLQVATSPSPLLHPPPESCWWGRADGRGYPTKLYLRCLLGSFHSMLTVCATWSMVVARLPLPMGWITTVIRASISARRRLSVASSHQRQASSKPTTSANGSLAVASAILIVVWLISSFSVSSASFAAVGCIFPEAMRFAMLAWRSSKAWMCVRRATMSSELSLGARRSAASSAEMRPIATLAASSSIRSPLRMKCPLVHL